MVGVSGVARTLDIQRVQWVLFGTPRRLAQAGSRPLRISCHHQHFASTQIGRCGWSSTQLQYTNRPMGVIRHRETACASRYTASSHHMVYEEANGCLSVRELGLMLGLIFRIAPVLGGRSVQSVSDFSAIPRHMTTCCGWQEGRKWIGHGLSPYAITCNHQDFVSEQMARQRELDNALQNLPPLQCRLHTLSTRQPRWPMQHALPHKHTPSTLLVDESASG